MDETTLNQSFEETGNRIEKVIEATDRLVGGPLEKLIERLSKTADASRSASESFDKFAEDILELFTKRTVDGIFGGLSIPEVTTRTSTRTAEGGGFIEDLLGAVLPGLPPGGESAITAGGVQLVIHNNSGAEAQVNERVNSRGEREIEIMIDRMVANSLAKGGATRSVLRSVFGLDNLLRSR